MLIRRAESFVGILFLLLPAQMAHVVPGDSVRGVGGQGRRHVLTSSSQLYATMLSKCKSNARFTAVTPKFV